MLDLALRADAITHIFSSDEILLYSHFTDENAEAYKGKMTEGHGWVNGKVRP